MKEINPDIKVLLSSGYSIDGEATEILERGCDSFIQKPFNMKELSRAIREVLVDECAYHFSVLHTFITNLFVRGSDRDRAIVEITSFEEFQLNSEGSRPHTLCM